MLSILMQGLRLKKCFLPILVMFFLAGCVNLLGSSFTASLKNDANASSDFYIRKIEQTQNQQDLQTYKLLAARVLVTENKIPQAEAYLAELIDLNDEQKLDKSLIEAHISAVKGKNETAEYQLSLIHLTSLSPSQKSRYYEIVSRIAENRHDNISAIKARIQMDNFLSDIQRKQQNNDRTWALLRNTDSEVLNNTDAEGNITLSGWLTLAQLYNDNLNQPAQLIQTLLTWKNYYPTHTAAHLLPTELQGLANFQQTTLTQVGLILPLSGNTRLIGETIKNGFDDAKVNYNVQVHVFDSMKMSIEQIINQAKKQGINTLVGPLLKQNVDVIVNNPYLVQDLNVLALNSTPNARAIEHLCYYVLSPEDEAESAASKMWNDTVRIPLVLVPQNNLGRRTAAAFTLRWQQLLGTDANIKFYNQTADINFALKSGLSESTDGVYIIANNKQLAEIKAVLDNINPTLKLYASSRSNSPNSGPEHRLFLNNLQFSDIPFFKDRESEQYKKIEKMTNNDYSLMHLYAMGYDAWLLINQFNEFRQIPGFTIDGLTGKLSAGPNCNVERDMTWFQYQNGSIYPLNEQDDSIYLINEE
ncbi:penicillin-binding protein activator [Histophilus somni]|uniref:penicillin-binding protein activator n=1 Tax=Histophilus somni TaxID=731 RepID=UPI00094B3662|nr:penicillin-binding protein activator [Histophilus somni]